MLNKIFFVVAVCLVFFSCRTAYKTTGAVEEDHIVFEPDSNYASMRIPALVMTNKGTLLAFCEARIGTASDWADMDLALRRSTDGGKTWGLVQVLASSRNKSGPVGNPAPIVDKDGKIHLLFQRDYARGFYTYSDDDGLSWKSPKDITAVYDGFKPQYNWNVLATGPGHGIQLKNGRLLVPIWMASATVVTPRRRHAPSCAATVYSDDGGNTWNRGELVADSSAVISNPNESMAVQLQDGRVLMSIRNPGKIKRRAFSISSDGVTNWSPVRFDSALFDPTCMASIIAVPAKNNNEKPAIVFINPDSRHIEKNPRQNLTAKISYDNGYTWPVQKVLNSGASGYSDLAIGPDGMLYCLYETNTVSKGFNYSLVLKKFNIKFLLNK